MFHIEFFVEDRHVLDMMRYLAGKARDLKVVPVDREAVTSDRSIDKVSTKPKRGPKPAGDTSLQDIFDDVRKRHPDEFYVRDLKPILGRAGLSPGSATYFISKAGETGIVKMIRKEGHTNIYGWKS